MKTLKQVQNINKSEVDHIENADKNQYLIRGSESNQKLSKIIHDFSRSGQKGKQFTKKQFRQEKSKFGRKRPSKRTEQKQQQKPYKKTKKIHLGDINRKTKTNGKRKQEKITRGGDLRTGNQQAS